MGQTDPVAYAGVTARSFDSRLFRSAQFALAQDDIRKNLLLTTLRAEQMLLQSCWANRSRANGDGESKHLALRGERI